MLPFFVRPPFLFLLQMSNDFDKYKIKLNVASARMFEHLADKSFFEMNETEDDTLLLAYCCLAANNDFRYTYDVFKSMLENKKISNWLSGELTRGLKYIGQFSKVISAGTEGEEEVEKPATVSAYASALIITFGMDPHYVNYEMPFHEMEDYFKAGELKRRNELEEKRMFTFLTMVPHLDMKKKPSPQTILPFPWEKEYKQQNAEEDLKKKKEMILATFKAMNEKKEEDNG